MVFPRRVSDSKSPQVFRNLLSILVDLNNAVVWIVSLPLISKSFKTFINSLGIAPMTIGINVSFIYNNFSVSMKVDIFICLFTFVWFFFLWSPGKAKSTIWQVLSFCFFFVFFFLCFFCFFVFFVFLLSFGLVIWPRLSDTFVCQNPRELCAFTSPG